MVRAGQKGFWFKRNSLFGGEDMRPGRDFSGPPAGAVVVVLGIVSQRRRITATPNGPAGGAERFGQFGVHHDDAGVSPPRAPEPESGSGRLAGRGWQGIMRDMRVGDHVAGGLVGRSARLCGNLTVSDFADLRVIEDGGCVAEDEVDAAGDKAVDVVLASVVGKKRVLIAEKAAVLEDGTVGAHGGSNGLAGWAGFVGEGDVVGFKVVAVDLSCFGEECATGHLGVLAGGDDNLGGVFAEAEQRHTRAVLGNVDALVIGAGNDLNIDAAMRGFRGMVERLLDGGVVGRAGSRAGAMRVDFDVNILSDGWDGEKREQEETHGA